jgi:hypothetical protein
MPPYSRVDRDRQQDVGFADVRSRRDVVAGQWNSAINSILPTMLVQRAEVFSGGDPVLQDGLAVLLRGHAHGSQAVG